MSVDALKQEFVPKFLSSGEQKFYRLLLLYAINKIVLIKREMYKGISPEIELINYYDEFLFLYRKEGERVYFNIAKIFRKAAHKIYRILLSKKMIDTNERFLNSV